MKLGGWKPSGQPTNRFRGTEVGNMRMATRQGHWLKGYIQAVSEGLTGKDALLRGGRLGGIGGANALGDLAVVKKMEAFLSLPDIKQALRNVYAEVGFELPEAIETHIKHIRGYEVEQQQVTKEGLVVDYTETVPPNYAALKDYIAMVTPREPKRVNVLTARANPDAVKRTDGSAPPMAPRFVGEQIIEG